MFEEDLKEQQLDEEQELGSGSERSLLCARCRHRITDTASRIEMHERHEHTFVNPGGFVYHIGCFSTAPGCLPVGSPSTELTWFRGYAWIVEHCAGCGGHLGWLFRSDSHHFHGLVLDRLIEEDD